jgi:hypothetical protein
VVFSGGFARSTEYINKNTLVATGIGLSADAETEVIQVAADGFRYD